MSHTATDMTVANEIQRQLTTNGNALFMIGTKQLVADSTSLRIKFTTSRLTNYIKITLRGDLYDMEFGRIRGMNYKVVEVVEGVFADQMKAVIRRVAQVETTL